MQKNNMDSNDLECINSFGAIFKNEVILPKYNSKVSFRIEDIKSFVMIKRRTYLNNVYWFLLLTTINVGLIFFYFEENRFFIFCVVLFLSLIIVYFIKKYKYKIHVLLVHKDFEINVDGNFKKDAKEIVTLINKKIKKNKLKIE